VGGVPRVRVFGHPSSFSSQIAGRCKGKLISPRQFVNDELCFMQINHLVGEEFFWCNGPGKSVVVPPSSQMTGL
jgi:hypothetical protein